MATEAQWRVHYERVYRASPQSYLSELMDVVSAYSATDGTKLTILINYIQGIAGDKLRPLGGWDAVSTTAKHVLVTTTKNRAGALKILYQSTADEYAIIETEPDF